ncbi:MAG: hypothetical protein OHK0012_11590 [Synechococcales cyanobacterium]
MVLSDHYAELQGQHDSLQLKFAQLHHQFLLLQSQMGALAQERASLEATHQTTQGQLAETQSTLADLTDRWQATQAENVRLEEQLQAQTALIHEQGLALHAAHTETQQVRERLSTTQHEHHALVDRYQDLEQRYAALTVLEELRTLMETEAMKRLSEVEQAIAINQEIFNSIPGPDLEHAAAITRQYGNPQTSTPVLPASRHLVAS